MIKKVIEINVEKKLKDNKLIKDPRYVYLYNYGIKLGNVVLHYDLIYSVKKCLANIPGHQGISFKYMDIDGLINTYVILTHNKETNDEIFSALQKTQ